MTLRPEYLFYLVLFVATLLLVEGAYYFVQDLHRGPKQAVNRRLRLMSSDLEQAVVLRKVRREDAGLFGVLFKSAIPWLHRLRQQSGTTVTSSRLTLIMVLTGFGLLLLLWQALPLLVAPPLAAAGGLLLPIAFLAWKRKRRLRRFARQLPDALDLIVRGLRAGHPVTAALGLVAKEMSDPIGSEFGIAVDEITYGLSLTEAMQNMGARIPLPDLQFVLVALQIQHGSGGNLAEILSGLATVIRERFLMFAKAKATSAEGRFSGLVLSLLPFAVGTVVHFMVPHYFGDVVEDPIFLPLMGLASGALLVGWVWIWRIVNFRI